MSMDKSGLELRRRVWDKERGYYDKDESFIWFCPNCLIEIQNDWDHEETCKFFKEEPLKKFLQDGMKSSEDCPED